MGGGEQAGDLLTRSVLDGQSGQARFTDSQDLALLVGKMDRAAEREQELWAAETRSPGSLKAFHTRVHRGDAGHRCQGSPLGRGGFCLPLLLQGHVGPAPLLRVTLRYAVS